MYNIFKEPVDENEVPGYSESITNPMDFGTMMSKVRQGSYGEGSDAATIFYMDLLLVFDNCNKFNQGEGEVVEEAASVLKAAPLCYALSIQAVIKEKRRPRKKKER